MQQCKKNKMQFFFSTYLPNQKVQGRDTANKQFFFFWPGQVRVGYLGSVHAFIYATLGTKCTFPMHRPTVHYSLSYRIPSPPPPLYTPNPYHHILSIPLIHHVSLAFTYYSILSCHTLPYPTLNYFTLPLLKLDRNDSWQKRLHLIRPNRPTIR